MGILKNLLNHNINKDSVNEKELDDFKKANEKLRQLDKTKSDFISLASHQLRTPLTAIKGYVSMMVDGDFGEFNNQAISVLKRVYSANEKLIQLVENLLNVSRIESGRLYFNFQDSKIEEIVKNAINELSHSAEEKNLRLIYKKLNKIIPIINIDEEKIKNVIINLINNAIKYTTRGSIIVSLKANKENVEFCVSDSGLGIRHEDMPKLFKKFSRGLGMSLVDTEGTGLGLYVSRMLIKSHKGKIWAESKGSRHGSSFCFTLPIKKKIKNK